jgi:hypothetical protein
VSGPSSQLTALIDDSLVSGIEIPFNSGDDDYGVKWTMSSLDGWDSPDLPEAAESKPGMDGMWDALNFYGGRTLSIEGQLVALSYEAREAAEYRLRWAVPRDRLVMVTVGETTPKWVMARRSGRLMVSPLTETMSKFSIALLAPDPRKYGPSPVTATLSADDGAGGLAPPWTPPVLLPVSASSPDQATLTNVGIYESPPTIIIRGPGSAISIHNITTGRHLTYDLTLAVTDYLVVDVASGVGLLNGSAIRAPAPGSTVTSQFLVAPGANLFRIFGTLTDVTPPSADISFYSSWI